MKITIATMANVRPDFIELQQESIRRFVEDVDVEYVVFNTAYDNAQRFNQIETICSQQKIKTISVKSPSYIRRLLNKRNASRAVGFNLNTIWKKHLSKEKGLLVLIDSDMFFMKKVSIEKLFSDKDLCIVPKYHGANLAHVSIWTGLMFFNMDTLPSPEELRWEPGSMHGYKVDVGGLTSHYIQKHTPELKICYMEMWNLEDIIHFPSGNKQILCSLNGNIRFVIDYDPRNTMIQVQTKDPFLSRKKLFPYQKEQSDFFEYISKKFLEFELVLSQEKLELPHPFWIDFFNTADSPLTESFIFHYKSGSNWLPFSTDEYNAQKTRAVAQFIKNK